MMVDICKSKQFQNNNIVYQQEMAGDIKFSN